MNNSMTNTNTKHNNKRIVQKKHRLGMVSKKILEGLNIFLDTNPTPTSDIDQDTSMFGLHERSLTYP